MRLIVWVISWLLIEMDIAGINERAGLGLSLGVNLAIIMMVIPMIITVLVTVLLSSSFFMPCKNLT